MVHFDQVKRCHPVTSFPVQMNLKDQPEDLPLYLHFNLELIECDAVRGVSMIIATVFVSLMICDPCSSLHEKVQGADSKL